MFKKTYILSSFCLAWFSLFNVALADTFFIYQSQPGDFIGKGINGKYDETQASFSIYETGNYGFNLFIDNSQIFWGFTFSAPTVENLTTKNYLNASRSATTVTPGIDISATGSGCNRTSGQFKILDIAYDGNGKIASLAVDFVQHCDKNKPALFGAIRYKSSIPNDLDQYIADLDITTDMVFRSQTYDYIGIGKNWQFSNDEKAYRLNMNNNHLSTSYAANEEWWDLDFSSPANTLLTPRYYENAQRWPFQDQALPGLDVGGDSRGCNTLRGRFKIYQIDQRPDGSVEHFAAAFEQHCECGDPALFGALRYRSNATIDLDYPAHFNYKDKIFNLPYLFLVDAYKNVTMKLVSEDPVTFQVASIEDFKGPRDTIRFPQYFSTYHQTLTVPQLTYVDMFGKEVSIENLTFATKSDGIHVGDLLELKPEGGHSYLTKLLSLGNQ